MERCSHYDWDGVKSSMPILTQTSIIDKLKFRDFVDFSCDCCDTRFQKTKGFLYNHTKKGHKNFFCSLDCQSKARKLAQFVNCFACNKSFEKSLSQIKNSNVHFCSRSCANKINNLIPKRKFTKKCKHCDTLISKRKTYCSQCIKSWLSTEDFTLAEIHNKAKYQKSALVRNLARRKMRKNNISPECKICRYSTHVEVCHIKAIKTFDSDSKISTINDLNNLVYMCPNHHWEFDNNIIPIVLQEQLRV